MSAATDFAKQTTLHFPEFCHLIATKPGYNYKNTNWYKAGVALEAEAKTPVTPPPAPPPPPSPLAAAQGWLVLAENPLWALNAPRYYKLALTADLGYRDWYTTEFFTAAHNQGRVMAPWCDCRTDGNGTPPSVAFQMAHDYNLQPPLGQGESSAEGDNARQAGMRIVMGKVGEQSSATVAAVKSGALLWIEEDYWNCGAGPRDYHNLPVAGSLAAVYKDAQCAGMPLSAWVSSGRYVAHQDSMYGPQMSADDYKALP